jgi:hypothetical protein
MKAEEVRHIVSEAVRETLVGLGVKLDDPTEVQADFAHLRKLRLGCEATKKNIIRAFITVTVPAGLYVFWEAFKGVVK